jgi:hypothetical protein
MSRARDFADLAGSADAGGLTGRNLIINGAMQVAQRGAGPTAIGSGYYTLDRFQTNKDNDGAFTNEQSTDHPNGAGNSLKWAVTTADTSVDAGQFLYFNQKIEAQDLQHLLYGTSSAKSLTLSFWVKSNKTGTYTIFVRKLDSTAYHFVHEYTISSADTWEKKEITISPTAGSTSFITSAAGVIDNDNGTGLQIGWNLAFGSTYNGATNNAWSSNTNHYATSNQVNWMDSTSNTFYLTEVQLEVGEQATPFEHRSYGDELARCERYYQILSPLAGHGNGTNFYNALSFNTAMRTQPTLSCASNTMDYTDGYASNYNSTNANPVWISYIPHNGGRFRTENHASVSADARRGTMMLNSNISIKADSEL